MGRSRGGLTTKIHAVVDADGRPIRLALTAGQDHDGRTIVTDTLQGFDPAGGQGLRYQRYTSICKATAGMGQYSGQEQSEGKLPFQPMGLQTTQSR